MSRGSHRDCCGSVGVSTEALFLAPVICEWLPLSPAPSHGNQTSSLEEYEFPETHTTPELVLPHSKEFIKYWLDKRSLFQLCRISIKQSGS